jgi:hypothetical protein
MNIRERLEAFWSGERPDQIPYTIYQNEWRHTQDDPAWGPMFEDGLGVTWPMQSFRIQTQGVEVVEQVYVEDGSQMRRQTRQTPVGEISATWMEGWHRKYWVETAEDYQVMTYIVEHTQITPDYETYLAQERQLPLYCIALPDIGRTPLQTILVDLAGLENFGWHLFEYEEEVRRLYDALLKNFRRLVEIVAEGPGRYVACMENFTAETLGPRRYEEFLLPVYDECFSVLHDAGKIVGCHYDGRTASCKDQIDRAPIDLIESLTPPPEGDQTLAQARAAWPDKLFWSNINVACYDLAPEELKRVVLERVEEAAPDGHRLAFEVSEQYPDNWKTSMPVVLEALKETRA